MRLPRPAGARRSQRHSDNGGDRGQHEPPRDTIAPVTIARELSGQMPHAQVAEFDALHDAGRGVGPHWAVRSELTGQRTRGFGY